jgi:hypothetical protein
MLVSRHCSASAALLYSPRQTKEIYMQNPPKRAALAIALFATLGVAHATNLVANSPTTSIDIVAGSFGGTLLDSASTLVSNMSYNGTARAAVYDTGTGLDFYYQFTNNASSVNGIERFTAADFSSLGTSAVSVFQTSAAFGIFTAGIEEAENADRTNFGVIGFNFVLDATPKLRPGETSFTQIVRTNARAYTTGTFGLIDGYADNAKGFATAVPEPESYALLLAGLGVMGALVRRRKGTPS